MLTNSTLWQCQSTNHTNADEASLVECKRFHKWCCNDCQNIHMEMIVALRKWENIHWYCNDCDVYPLVSVNSSAMDPTTGGQDGKIPWWNDMFFCFCFFVLNLNHYAPVSQANWCNMNFTAGNLFPLIHALGDLSQTPTGIWTWVPKLRGRRLTNWTIPPPSMNDMLVEWYSRQS